MSVAFDTAIAALWRGLGLSPVPAGSEAPRLRVDGHVVHFEPAPNGRDIVVSSPLGSLAAAGPARVDQLRSLLRTGLGTALTNRAGLRMAENSTARIEVVALAPGGAGAAASLRGTVEDVLSLLDLHAPTLEGAGRRARPDAEAPFSLHDSLIFRL